MKDVFFIVGPTATGKSVIAAEVAREINGEIVSADAFQIYEGFAILSAKPGPETVAKAAHHLIGAVPPREEMNAGKFCRLALPLLDEIRGRSKPVLVVGGSGLYVKALTHGLDGDWTKMNIEPKGVLLLRDRPELYTRINQRVEGMFGDRVIDEVRNAGVLGSTASKMIGVREIRGHLSGELSVERCVEKIQIATRQYAKRQLTWFRHQTNFEPLNLSLLSQDEAVQWICQRARPAFAEQG